MVSQSVKLRKVSIVATIVFVLLLSGCSLPLPTGRKTNTPDPLITPIVSISQPSREMQACFDTAPIVPDPLFRAATALVANLLDGSVNVNEAESQVYISYITSSSYLKDAFSFSIPAITADPQEPTLEPIPDPAKFTSQYDYSKAVDKVNAENKHRIDTWQVELRSNHVKLAAAKSWVLQYTNRLRSLPNVKDLALEDVAGCLLSASERFQGFSGRKTLILASPLVHMVDASNGINLAGAHVEVIMRSCQVASASDCIASSSAWKQKFLSFGASSVSIRDPQQSLVEKLTF